ncbi:MAG: DUF2071 domain-containing protein [Actinomycetota bacterium]
MTQRFTRLATAEVDVQNFALVTHAVPAERVRRILPARFELETFTSEDGRELALISSSVFCNRQLHWSPARYPAHDFDQCTFRTYVTWRGRRGAYFFGTYVGTRLSYVAQKLVAAGTRLADFDVDIQGGTHGYPVFDVRVVAGDQQLMLQLEARDRPTARHPFVSGNEHAQFITYRLHGFARSPFGETYGPIEHRHMDPWSGRLLQGRFDLWEQLGILEPEEAEDVFSVLVEPSVRFTLHVPRRAAL